MSHPYLARKFCATGIGLLLGLLLHAAAWAQAGQRFTLSGRVRDAGGQGLPGATVLLKGTTQGATTGLDGACSLTGTQAPGAYTLTVSLVGYRTESRPVTLGGAEPVTTDVLLAESRQNLDEVVVVVGSTVTTSRRELGNAISTISGNELTRSGSGGVLNSLQGKVPGAQITQNSGDPAGSISVRLRGVHSLAGSSDPLYVIRARLDQRLTSWAKVSAGLSYSNSFANEKATGNVFYSPINSVNITNNIYDITRRDASGNLLAVEPTRVNPLSTIEDMKFTQGINRTISDVQVSLTPVKGLSVDYVLGVDAYSQAGQSYVRPYPCQATAGLPAARYPLGFAANGNNVAQDIYGLGAALPPYAGAMTQAAVLLEILRNRDIELAFQGFRLPDSRRFGRPGPGTTGAERNRTFYPYPRTERENNSSTPADPAT